MDREKGRGAAERVAFRLIFFRNCRTRWLTLTFGFVKLGDWKQRVPESAKKRAPIAYRGPRKRIEPENKRWGLKSPLFPAFISLGSSQRFLAEPQEASREEENMRRFLGVMAILAIATPAFAADVLTGAQPVDFGSVPTLNRVSITVNPITGEQSQTTTSEDRSGKVVSYESMNLAVARYFYPPLPGQAFADDLLLDKSSGKLLMNRYETYTYAIGAGDNVKIDFYSAVSGPYLVLPSVASKFLTIQGAVPAGLALIDITFDPPIPKDDFIWVSFQSGGIAGQILAEVQQTVGDGFLEGPAGNGFFYLNNDKDNDNGWAGAYYFGPNPPGPRGDFLQRVWNSPEPTTLALAGGALVAFFRRRR